MNPAEGSVDFDRNGSADAESFPPNALELLNLRLEQQRRRSRDATREVKLCTDRWMADPTEGNRTALAIELIVSIALQESVLTCLDHLLRWKGAELGSDGVAELIVARTAQTTQLERVRFFFTEVTGLQP